MRILDLGCGEAKVEGALGVDSAALPGVDVVADLNEYPYPFADNSFDRVYLLDIIEHLPDTIATMEEIHQICRPGGKVFVRVVNWNSKYAAMDPTHVKSFTEHSFDFFGKREQRSYYSAARFNVVRVDKGYNTTLKKWLRSDRLLHFLSHYLCNVLISLNFELSLAKNGQAETGLEDEKDADLWSLLRCPRCLTPVDRSLNSDPGRLKQDDSGFLICTEIECGRKYPILDGRPVFSPANVCKKRPE